MNLSALDKDGLLNVLPTQYGEVRIQTAVVQRMGALSSVSHIPRRSSLADTCSAEMLVSRLSPSSFPA